MLILSLKNWKKKSQIGVFITCSQFSGREIIEAIKFHDGKKRKMLTFLEANSIACFSNASIPLRRLEIIS